MHTQMDRCSPDSDRHLFAQRVAAAALPVWKDLLVCRSSGSQLLISGWLNFEKEAEAGVRIVTSGHTMRKKLSDQECCGTSSSTFLRVTWEHADIGIPTHVDIACSGA